MIRFPAGMSACALLCASAAIYLWVENNHLKSDFALERKRFQDQIQQQSARYQETIAAFNAYLQSPAQHRDIPPSLVGQGVSADAQQRSLQPTFPVDPATRQLLDAEARSLQKAVSEKYRALLTETSLNTADTEQLLSLLRERERLTALPTENYFTDSEQATEHMVLRDQALADLDQRIVELLDGESARLFELTRNSEFEQHQLREITDKLSVNSPLSPDQERTLLLTKLRHKVAFEEAMQSYALTQTDKRALANEAVKALNRYRDDYLQEASAYLSEDQMTAVTDYEALSFEEMEDSLLASLQAQ
ncbi:conserved hypothetical protein [Hahella chejuensis KCTC 2396]|uniref:Uncharacterized protein n=1 Tax=Hahella chejuensis (strain KCTC 2396) TaxID=349521 RepID=Q2SNP9_HAHCH|nr:hypothetical protein [Hahella chejuensis]ABC27725.1 conserved hypothetical protein [Hahella chejuensis KCTC 2396]